MLDRATVLDNLTELVDNFLLVTLRVIVDIVLHAVLPPPRVSLVLCFIDSGLHDVVPRQVETRETSILLQNRQQSFHLLGHELVPANVQTDERFLGADNFTKMHHAKVIEACSNKGQLPKVVPRSHLLADGERGSPHCLAVDQVELLQVVWHLPLQHRVDLISRVIVDSTALDSQVDKLLLVAEALENEGKLVAVKAVRV